VCCNTHLVQMPPVSMRMAKLQKATLDPTKISGRCGRLKCCLRYEYESYEHGPPPGQGETSKENEKAQTTNDGPPATNDEARMTNDEDGGSSIKNPSTI
jgi:cell fate regulator YaaT (PSP1 superfamily)